MRTVCVTGAGGFVGGALARALLSQGFQVRAIARRPLPDLEKLGIKVFIADLSKDTTSLIAAFQDVETVFHTAAKVDMWGKYQDFYDTNVIGANNLIQACTQAGVKKLIFTSSPSVVADGNNLSFVDESYPIPAKHHAAYPATKALAEKIILTSNGPSLKTLALRPHLIFGPGDRHFIPTILQRAKQGRLLVVGDGNNIVDVCFIEDCVRAHILANEALDSTPEAAGRAYFISQDDPIKLWEFIGLVLEAHGLSPLKRKISKSMALLLAGVFEFISKVVPIKPLFTRFLVSEMTTDHYFNLKAAKELLGFEPRYSVREAIRKSFSE